MFRCACWRECKRRVASSELLDSGFRRNDEYAQEEGKGRHLFGCDPTWIPAFAGMTGRARSEVPDRLSGVTYTSFAPLRRPATSLIPTPGPLGTVILPSLTVIGGSNQLPNFSVPSLYS